jgi:hypothetical protein
MAPSVLDSDSMVVQGGTAATARIEYCQHAGRFGRGRELRKKAESLGRKSEPG